MADCYGNQVASTGENVGVIDTTVNVDGNTTQIIGGAEIGSGVGYVKNYKIAPLNNHLITMFKDSANFYHIDWRWLAAFAAVESGFNVYAFNKNSGYYGLFQFKQSTMCKGKSVTNPREQCECTASNIVDRIDELKKKYKNVDEETCYLYAAVAHNAGNGAAAFFMNRAKVKNIGGIINVLKNDSMINWPKHWYKLTSAKRKEISEYPIKIKSAYITICSKYKL